MSAKIEVRGISYQYPGGHGVRDISFNAGAGEVVCIFGWNGAGKTTLLKVLSTLFSPQSGYYCVDGFEVTRDRESVRRKVFPVFDTNAHFSHLTGRENARFFMSLYEVVQSGTLDRIAENFKLDLDRPAGEYSLGMKRKLMLAESFASGRDVLIFDEPTLGLDSTMREAFFSQVREVAKRGTCNIIGTNRIEDAGVADRILSLDKGRLCQAASIEALVARMIRITITVEDRELVEYIPSIDVLPQMIKKILSLGIPRRIEIGETGTEDSLQWTEEAEEKVRHAPPVLQAMIRSLVVRYANDHGYKRITPDVVEEVKKRFEQR